MARQRTRTRNPAPIQIIRFPGRRPAAATTLESPAVDGRSTLEGLARATTEDMPACPPFEEAASSAAAPAQAVEAARLSLEDHHGRLGRLASRPSRRSRSLADRALFGQALYSRGRVREAQVVFEGIVAQEPDEPVAYTMLGAIYVAQGDEGRALALFEAALAIEPDDPAALVGRAEIRLRRGQARAALKDLERASAHPDRDDPFRERARALCAVARPLAREVR